jgi:iron complex transport system substrate-binding protein
MAARAKRLIVALLVGTALACGRASPDQTTGPAPARRIISLVPALTEIVFAIGAGPQVIAVSSYDNDPPEVKTLPRVGALLDPDTERILSMKPDLVLVYGSQAELLDHLSRADIPTFRYRHGGLAELATTFRQVGELTGHLAEAARRSDEIERRLDQVRRRVAGRGRPRTLLVISREPMSLRQVEASGGVGFLNDLIQLAGGANVFADVGRQAVHASTEMLLAKAPDVIVDLHYTGALDDAQLQKEREVWRPLASIPAVKSNRVQLLVGDYLVVPGPRIVQAAEEYARAIHPDAFTSSR